jgi:hypothetical protein
MSLLKKICQNILTDPVNEKFRTLKLKNELLSKFLFNFDTVLLIFEMIGFEIHSKDGEQCQIIRIENINFQSFENLIAILDKNIPDL